MVTSKRSLFNDHTNETSQHSRKSNMLMKINRVNQKLLPQLKNKINIKCKLLLVILLVCGKARFGNLLSNTKASRSESVPHTRKDSVASSHLGNTTVNSFKQSQEQISKIMKSKV